MVASVLAVLLRLLVAAAQGDSALLQEDAQEPACMEDAQDSAACMEG